MKYVHVSFEVCLIKKFPTMRFVCHKFAKLKSSQCSKSVNMVYDLSHRRDIVWSSFNISRTAELPSLCLPKSTLSHRAETTECSRL